MRKLMVMVMLAVAAPAFAVDNMLVNGDFSAGENGWTQWNSSWGGTFTWDASLGDGRLSTGTGSFGWWQAITTVPGNFYTITADWAGDGNLNWVEILFFNDDGRSMVDQLDAPLNSSILTKVDGWGMNGGMPFGPAAAMNGAYWFASGPMTNTILATGTTMFVGLKTGSVGSGTSAIFDNVMVTPEPAAALLLLAGLPMLRRRR